MPNAASLHGTCAKSATNSRPLATWPGPGPGRVRNGRCGPRRPFTGLLLGGIEVERQPVDAVALAGRRGAVRKDVAEVGLAGGAADLDPPHAVAQVELRLDRVLARRLEEARPA